MKDEFFTPKQLVERLPWMTLGTLRKYLAKRDINGLDKYQAVICLSARKLLIHEARFLEWIDSHT